MKKRIVFLAAILLAIAFVPAFAADLNVFQLDGDHTAVLYKGQALANVAAQPVDGGVEGSGIEYWVGLDAQNAEEIAEEEAGLWFFAPDGKALRFLPRENASEPAVLYVSFGPEEKTFVVAGGGYHTDLSYSVYQTSDMKELASDIAGLAGVLWLGDPYRFAFTRIDDVREVEGDDENSYFRFSAVVYDSAVDLTTVLKEATDDANYLVDRIDEENGKIILREQTVKDPKDWGDEEKMEEREISVDFPAAG
jgi:hypothetical protein